MLDIQKTIAVTFLALTTIGIQNPALALVNQPMSSSGLVSINTNTLPLKQSNLVADNTTYWSPQRDCKILMPGIVTGDPTEEELTSVSASTPLC